MATTGLWIGVGDQHVVYKTGIEKGWVVGGHHELVGLVQDQVGDKPGKGTSLRYANGMIPVIVIKRRNDFLPFFDGW